MEKLLKDTGVDFSEIKYELVDYQSVIDNVREKGVLDRFRDNIVYSPLDLAKDRGRQRTSVDLILMCYVIDCMPTTILKIDESGKLFRREIRIVYLGPGQLSEAEIEEIKLGLKNKDYEKIAQEVKRGLVAEIRDVKVRLTDLDEEKAKYLKERLKMDGPGEVAFHEVGVEILDEQLADLKSEGYLINSDFGPSTLNGLYNYRFVSNGLFKNSAYPLNFHYLRWRYPHSVVATDKKISSWLVTKDGDSLTKVASKFRAIIEPNSVAEVGRRLRKIDLLIRTKNKQAALKLVAKLTKLDMEDDQLLMEVAYCYFDLGEYSKAIEYAEKVVKLREKPQDLAAPYFLMAQCYRLVKDNRKAEECLQKVMVSEGVKSSEVFNERGRLEFANGQIQEAVKDFEESFRLKPSWSALINEFETYRRLGNPAGGAESVLVKMIREVDWRYLADPEIKKEIKRPVQASVGKERKAARDEANGGNGIGPNGKENVRQVDNGRAREKIGRLGAVV